jgi:hypothetical protein
MSQQKKVITREQFKLEKFKLISGDGMEVHFETDEDINGQLFYDKHHITSPKTPHKDFTDKIKELKPMFAKAFDFSYIRDLVSNPSFESTKEQKVLADKTYDEILKKITITGVTVSCKADKDGKKDANRGCVIMATFTFLSGKKQGLVTERIKYGTKKYGFEETLETMLYDFEDEAYAYVYDNKMAVIDGTLPFAKGVNDDDITEVDFEETDETDQQEETEKPKKKKGKK